MESGEKHCRRCLLRDTLDEKQYFETVERVRRAMNPRVRTPDAQYEQRLDACRECDQLQNGTCMQCGCLVEMRAMRLDQHCPPPRKKW